MRKAITS